MEKEKKNMFIRKMLCIINVSEAELSGPQSFTDSWFNQRWSALSLYHNNMSLQHCNTEIYGKLTNESAMKSLDFYWDYYFFNSLLLSYDRTCLIF